MNRLELIKSYYVPNVGKGLPDYQVLGWESEEAQRMRFDVLLSKVRLDGKKILDVGCGLGNLLEYLEYKDIAVDYTGVDILEPMLECAKSKNPNGKFYCIDIFKNHHFKENSFDVIYASGIFNLNLGNNREFLQKAVLELSRLTHNVLAFNLLHYQSPGRDDRYFYFNPDEVIGMIEGLACGFDTIRVVEHYLNNDFSVICEK